MNLASLMPKKGFSHFFLISFSYFHRHIYVQHGHFYTFDTTVSLPMNPIITVCKVFETYDEIAWLHAHLLQLFIHKENRILEEACWVRVRTLFMNSAYSMTSLASESSNIPMELRNP